jgi:spore coat protein CotF
MTLYEEKLNMEVASNFAPFLLLNFENFWTSTHWATLETSTPQFSAYFEHYYYR